MDMSVILVFPFGALLAFAVALIAAIAQKPRPRLVWPFAVSTILTASAFVGPLEMAKPGYWALGFALVALWAALGTVAGATIAKLTIATARRLMSR
jgi:hypothetical protein